MNRLYKKWCLAKDAEKRAQEARGVIEEALIKELQIAENFEGSKTIGDDQYKVTYTGRMKRKVDSKIAQEIAAEIGAENMLSSLFRWKPEINKKEWEKTDKTITDKFAKAITSKPGKVSFKIEEIKQ